MLDSTDILSHGQFGLARRDTAGPLNRSAGADRVQGERGGKRQIFLRRSGPDLGSESGKRMACSIRRWPSPQPTIRPPAHCSGAT